MITTDFKEWQKHKHVAVYAAYFALLMRDWLLECGTPSEAQIEGMKTEAWRVAGLQQVGEP